ncbi:MAG: hypothetical protein J0I47_01160 [Sphingomonas sp.]|uniref:hypothetical protein n=1 Tax=Sphingomonas sp. TaxID=28214 RepID=UPI001AD3A4A2|nr:hypothetical protein [Sphingomonas sp.]MBN8806837.1 hypothetical protein [Sphingomonas sp.]
MRLPLTLALASLALAACSQKAQDELGQAGNTMSADANATMARAVNSVDAAADKAFGDAQNKADQISNAADDAKHKAGAAMKDIGNDIED